ncbi:MAG: hypothetical protein ACYTFG_16835, partial [Planctomycetota bacterium]
MSISNQKNISRVLCLSLAVAFLILAAPALGQTNVALTGTASTSNSNSSYPASRLNDNIFNTWNWISTSGNPDPNAWMEIAWTTPQTITSFQLWTVSATNRYLAQARVEYWTGSAWATDQTYAQQTTLNYTITLTQPRTTTRFRLINFLTTGSQASNPSTYEWQIFGVQGPQAPAWINYPANSSGGNYSVTWASTTGTGTVSYDLEEDTTVAFTAPTTVYSGTNLSFGVTNHPPGTFYYRVRGVDSIGPGAWCTGGPIVITVPPPGPPSMIIVPAQSATGAYTVSWTAATGAAQYELQEANNATFAGAAQVYLGANLSYNVTGKVG